MELNTYQILYEVEKYHWWFLGRRRIVPNQIEKLFRGRADLKTHDVTCGTGITMNYLKKYGTARGTDCSKGALKFCQKRGHYNLCQTDACNLALPDESYDLITALDLIESLDSDWQGLREFHRILKKGGKILIFVPAFRFLWNIQDKI